MSVAEAAQRARNSVWHIEAVRMESAMRLIAQAAGLRRLRSEIDDSFARVVEETPEGEREGFVG